MPRPINHKAAHRERELARQDKRQRKLDRRAAKDPRRQVHENAFPDAPEAYQGVARTLSVGLR